VRDQWNKNGSINDWRPRWRRAENHLQLVYSAPTRVRLPPLTGEDARQWVEEVAVVFLRDRIRDRLRPPPYLALVVDNGIKRPSAGHLY
jgi:hypothetical protein